MVYGVKYLSHCLIASRMCRCYTCLLPEFIKQNNRINTINLPAVIQRFYLFPVIESATWKCGGEATQRKKSKFVMPCKTHYIHKLRSFFTSSLCPFGDQHERTSGSETKRTSCMGTQQFSNIATIVMIIIIVLVLVLDIDIAAAAAAATATVTTTIIIKSPRSGVTLCFKFVRVYRRRGRHRNDFCLSRQMKTVSSTSWIFGATNVQLWQNVLDGLSMTLTKVTAEASIRKKTACLHGKVRSNHVVTTKVVALLP